jgi:hypothetical protein
LAINPDAVGATAGPVDRSWTSKDALLYALGVGAGASDPTGFELEFTTENSRGITQRVLPPVAAIAGGAVSAVRQAGELDFTKSVALFRRHDQEEVALGQLCQAGDEQLAQFPPARLAPDYLALVGQFCFGMFWSRPNLSRRDRSLISVAMLAAMGSRTSYEGILPGLCGWA